MKKKVSILIYSLNSGGAERVVSILLRELRDTFDITLVLMNESIFYDIPKDTKIVYLEKSNPMEDGIYKFLKLPLLGYKYKKICKQHKIEISLSFMNRPNYINLFSKFFGNKSKVLISERNTPSKVYGSNSLKDNMSKFLIKILYKKANKIIPNAEGIKNDLIRTFKIQSKKIEVINNPIDLKRVNASQNEKVDFDFGDKFTFVNIGSLHPQKNQELLIDAFSQLNCKKCQLLIIGDGELKNVLQKKINDLDLDDQVFLLGRKKNPYSYLKNSDCFVFSSDFEGFPNVLLEALACEVPIISTDCQSGPREILAPNTSVTQSVKNGIEFGEFGILVPVKQTAYLEEAMKTVLHDSELLRSYSKISKNRARSFNVNEITNKFMKLIRKI